MRHDGTPLGFGFNLHCTLRIVSRCLDFASAGIGLDCSFLRVPRMHRMACSASPFWSSVGTSFVHYVMSGKFMPSLAVRFPVIIGACSNTAQDIYHTGHWIQMERVHTVRSSARVIGMQSIWNWSDHQLICDSVRRPVDSMLVGKDPISASILSGSPKPTTVSLVDLAPKTLLYTYFWFRPWADIRTVASAKLS